MKIKDKKTRRKIRAIRVRAKIKDLLLRGKMSRPRLSVYKTNTKIIAQIIDDKEAKTLCYATTADKDIAGKTPTEKAEQLGEKIAKLAKDKGIEQIVFDRSGFAYAGKVKALADAARKAGLKF